MIKKIELFFKKNLSKIKWQEILAVLILFLAFVFFRSERKEMSSILPQLHQAKPIWISAGIFLTIIYVLLQAFMYMASFRAVGIKLKLSDALELFLKRNFLSVFLPAGGISSLAYTPRQLQRKDYDKNSIHKASAIYGFVGIVTVFLVGIPVVAYAALFNKNFGNSWMWLLGVGIFIALVFWMVNSLRTKGILYQFLEKHVPKKISDIDEFFAGEIHKKHFYITVLISVLIEFCGIFHLLIAMFAFGAEGSFSAAAVGYTISVLLMLVSPFLRGLGAVEFTLIYILASFGFSHSQGLGITLLYRVFEFWLPLLLGLFAFIWKGRKIVARIFPALAIFILGLINIISVITPPLKHRLKLGKLYLSEDTIHFSKILTLVAGILLLVTAAYMLRGLKRGWYFAMILAIISFFGNIIKALDYEEASFALFIILLLLISRKEYILKTNRKYLKLGFSWLIGLLISVVIFNFLSFYFIDKRHFGIDFTWSESLYYTIHSFLLFQDSGLVPKTGFARDFEYINVFLGIVSWLLLIFSLFNVRKLTKSVDRSSDFRDAQNLMESYGTSALDFFKTAKDKLFYFSDDVEGFISYRIANHFAIVLEEPVCDEEHKEKLIEEFEDFCKKNGLKSIYYRIDEQSLFLFKPFKKQKLFIGQEAIMKIEDFKLEGKDRKTLRNGLNSLSKKGYTSEILYHPQNEEILNEIQSISDEWLKEFDKEEMVFSQGMFDRSEIETQDLIVIKDEAGKIEAFLNVIPDFAPDECTYDLIRKTVTAPNGSMDAMIVKLVEYAKTKKMLYINLGLTPLGGMKQPDNTAEEILKFVYNRIGSFKHYQSLRDFKEKYANQWQNKYLMYSNDFDLLQIPAALNKITKPQ
ncbi:phosphatidylglycerol lysyltransferase domain-containing protein [Kaistella jeonii]|uniref:ABC transporter permease n=1 Tax=Kaistella jeonii TaxID=266749 RepID=A0A0C1D9R6_9FLAO|nr:phosphatidylglycerol lysyltransferase domain-containing protein [Kaistella jeonii]KIA90645.1 ABC transporter permease [Kaistella jeonii]SFB69609.1 phosphatidylglycerol lysyltransferase [Kaistella jeonii]VEI94753.1 Phosphatidylglycerol lysyltransferase [Kaistella jeonii]